MPMQPVDNTSRHRSSGAAWSQNKHGLGKEAIMTTCSWSLYGIAVKHEVLYPTAYQDSSD